MTEYLIQANNGYWYINPFFEGKFWQFHVDEDGPYLILPSNRAVVKAISEAKKMGLKLKATGAIEKDQSMTFKGTLFAGSCHRHCVEILEPIPNPQSAKFGSHTFPQYDIEKVIGWVFPVALVPEASLQYGTVKKGFWTRK